MYFSGYHGTSRPAFSKVDTTQLGSASGYEYAKNTFSLTSSETVAEHYAGATGSILEFSIDIDRFLTIDGDEMMGSISRYIAQAQDEGYHGLLIRQYSHTVVSPGEASDICVTFHPEMLRYRRTIRDVELRAQEGEQQDDQREDEQGLETNNAQERAHDEEAPFAGEPLRPRAPLSPRRGSGGR